MILCHYFISIIIYLVYDNKNCLMLEKCNKGGECRIYRATASILMATLFQG